MADAERITPIAAHPKFAPEMTAAAVDPRVIEGLRALDGDPNFLAELIETFRTDARQVMQRLRHAAAGADAAAFARSVIALQRAAGQLGGTQLCELLASWRNLTAGDLRQRGAGHVNRLEAEIERLLSALSEFLPSGAARQG
jgi:HPt (histidine-containing phosphotransfer) domain-containing protein